MSAEPLGIVTELVERRQRLVSRMSPRARHLAFPHIYSAPVVAMFNAEVDRLVVENKKLRERLAKAEAAARAIMPRLTPEVAIIFRAVADVCDVDAEELRGPRKPQKILEARMLAYYLVSRTHPRMTYGTMGKIFCRDHTTCITGVRRAKEMIGEDPYKTWLADERIVALLSAKV